MIFLVGISAYAVESDGGVFFENFRFADGKTGAILGSGINGEVSVNGEIDNRKSENAAGTFIGVIYDNKGRLAGISKSEITAKSGEKTDVMLKITPNGDCAKGKISCFFWNATQSPKPLAQRVDFENGIINYNIVNEFFVSADGAENGNGTEENPFNSITTAQNYIKSNKYKINSDIIVNIADGEYSITEPISLGYEDSGVYGNKIIYRGTKNGETVISGGEKLEGWNYEGNGIYSIQLPGRTYVRELYAGNKLAKRSRTESLVYGDRYYSENGTNIGIVIPYDEKIADIKENDGANIVSLADWRNTSILIKKVEPLAEDSSKLVIYFADGEKGAATAVGRFDTSINKKLTDGSTAGFGFHIENAMKLLDNANEFYFDRNSEILYYMPENGKTPDELDMHIPNTEVVLMIEGNHTGEKVSNVCFENLSFKYTKWNRAENMDYIPFQGAMIYGDDTSCNYLYPQNGMVPAAVQMEYAENIEFKNNTVACVGSCGIGLYNAVDNSVISGNIVTQTAHSGITIGLSGHMYDDEYGYNVAYRKPVTASSNKGKYPVTNVTDGDKEYAWVSEGDGDSWCIIDLGEKYKITGIGIHTWGAETAEDRNNFVIEGSNSPKFSFKSTIKTVTNELPGGTFTYLAPDKVNVTCQYIRYKKTGRSAVGDISIYTDAFGDVRSKKGCVNNMVSNNYISKVGQTYADAVGIQSFYTDSLTISNNTIKDVPYTAISLGWGWRRNTGSTFSKDNKILNNRIENSTQFARDGAAIYTLGYQPNMVIEGNYLKNTWNVFGAIYPDEGTDGSDGEKSGTIQIVRNVVEGGPMWFHGWHNTIKNMNVSNNYTTVDVQKNNMDSETVTMGENTYYVQGNPPVEANKIMLASGIEESHADIFNRLKRFGENYEKDMTEYIREKVNAGRLIDTFVLGKSINPAAAEVFNTAEYYINAGNLIADPERMTSGFRKTVKEEHLVAVMRNMEYYKSIVEANPRCLAGLENEYAEFNVETEKVKSVWNDANATQYEIFTARINGEKALKKFAQCGAFNGIDTTSVLGGNTVLQP